MIHFLEEKGINLKEKDNVSYYNSFQMKCSLGSKLIEMIIHFLSCLLCFINGQVLFVKYKLKLLN